MDWRKTNDRIYDCKRIRDATTRLGCLEALYAETGKDGFVALALGEHFEIEGDDIKADEFYSEAYHRLPMSEWKRWALQCQSRVGARLVPQSEELARLLSTPTPLPELGILSYPTRASKGRGGHGVPRLLRWSVQNFRSVKDANLELGKLTIVTGPNSSGKSSFVHSLLLVAQSLMPHGAEADQFPVTVTTNGSFLELGAPHRFLRHGAKELHVVLGTEDADVGFSYLAANSEIGEELRLSGVRVFADYVAGRPVDSAFWSHTQRLWKVIDASMLNGILPDLVRQLIQVHRETENEWAVDSENSAEDSPPVALREIELSSTSGTALRNKVECTPSPKEDRLSSAMTGFADPSTILGWEITPKGELQILVRRPHALVVLAQRYSAKTARGEYLSSEIIGVASKLNMNPEKAVAEACRALVEQYTGYRLGPEVDGALQAMVKRDLSEVEAQDVAVRVPCSATSEMKRAVQVLSRVRYVGPIRARSSARPGSEPEGGDLATTLLYAGRQDCTYYRPGVSTRLRESLFDAISFWLRYLGVGHSVSVKQPHIKHEVFVKISEHTPEVELASVGVGVSQVLPIIVEGLTSKRNAILVFEQPELHLHPRVQTRLGDFFLSLVRNDRQVILETHSEHLVDRVRLRVAEQGASPDQIRIYFASAMEDESTYQLLEIGPYGDLAAWPDGFFDESGEHAETMLRTVASRLKHEGSQR